MELRVGYCKCDLRAYPTQYVLYTLITHPEHTGKGDAKRVLRVAKKLSKKKKKPLLLQVSAFSHATISQAALYRFYAKQGFRIHTLILPSCRAIQMAYNTPY